ncbi:MAG TPA: hypothetical protein VGM60_20870 [Pseudonocardia sp.]|jgi:hypothetical protein|uniref:hypothetical protein n=1 Tax=Pseudonocardia sp. TaxID=60912 RepID=UPI002F3E2AFC
MDTTGQNRNRGTAAPARTSGSGQDTGLPAIRIGLVGGTVGMLCCVGPTVLALAGVLGAGTAYAWAEELYGGYAWWFRLGGLAVTVGLVVWALRRRQSCSLGGVRAGWRRLLLLVVVAVVTYLVLYAVTTLAGPFAR